MARDFYLGLITRVDFGICAAAKLRLTLTHT